MENNGSSGKNQPSSTAAATDSAGVAFDSHIYGETPAAHYVTEIDAETPLVAQDGGSGSAVSRASRSGQRSTEDGARIAERERMLMAQQGDGVEATGVDKSIAAREDFYRRQRFQRALSPERADPFSDGDLGAASRGESARTYADVMLEQHLDREKQAAVRQIRKLQEDAELQRQLQMQKQLGGGDGSEKKRRRWDWGTAGAEDEGLTEAERQELARAKAQGGGKSEEGAAAAAAALVSRWDTPLQAGGQTPGAWGETPLVAGSDSREGAGARTGLGAAPGKKKSRWDATPTIGGTGQETPTPGQWGATPAVDQAGTPILAGAGSVTPMAPGAGSGNVTPMIAPGSQTPSMGRKRSRWDATPVLGGSDADMAAAAAAGLTPGASTPMTGGAGMTPGKDGSTPMTSQLTPGMTPLAVTGMVGATPLTPGTPISTAEQLLQLRMQQEQDERTRYLTDEELDRLLPKEGYEIVPPPADYNPPPSSAAAAAARARHQAIGMTPGVAATPTPIGVTPLYTMPEEGVIPGGMEGLMTMGGGIGGQLTAEGGGVTMKAEDYQFFAKLFEDKDEDAMTQEEVKERKIQLLLLKIKNGTPPLRRSALRTLTEKSKEFGAAALFNQILPLMMQSTLEDQERHLLVKVIDRVLYRLDDAVRPYVHKILVVIEPLLIDEDYYARIEGREIISNLAKAAGLATMIATMRPDIDHPDEYVRNTTARAFAVVASALGIPSLILFLKAVCQSKKSWQARHTGIKIIQQMSILMGCGVLPHLKQLVEIIQHGLDDQVLKVKTVTALALAALAESAAPYGIEAFDSVLRPLWKGMGEMRGKGLAAYLKAIGSIIPLMDAYHASYYTREVMVMLVREFETNDEEMKKIVLRVVRQCVATEGVESEYIRTDIVPPFFAKVWLVRNALDRRTAKLLIETVVEIANKAGGAHIIQQIVEDLKDPSEPFRKVTLEALEQIIVNNGVVDVDNRLEEQLVDGLLYAFQEQTSEDATALLNGFSTIVNALGTRIKPYLPQICGVIRWRLNTPSAKLRQQAADLIARIAVVMQKCGEEQMLGHLGLFLYEYLGEEYPEVLGSILGALKAIVNVIGMNKMTPPIKDLLPRLTPILKNRHEKVQENVIDLVGRIADRGGDLVSPKEWDRICFDLLDMLKASKKAIRRATVNTFGYIARTIGPQDVLATLLNNLKVQERQLRLCTTIAIAIVAETCLPYSVLPALMNEYRVQELNVQNGVLKTLSFMFEYIGEMAKDYIYTVVPLLEDALMDRDLVHRQTAAWATKHLALGVHGLSCEDALLHLMNFVWPNIFEKSPHLVQAFFDAVDGMRVSLGAGIVFRYVLLGLFHPAKKVREVYWRVYNNLYIGHQDSMVAFYPPLPDDEKGCYSRDELLYVI
ncbi:putative U2 small nuclear ribonucleoprotein family protein [Toxoplasma gondii RUB]|uniref:Putative U2 small nuclear ribonucleoprotein family protein n=10 Tax=Toxoplasma gondii TaxID=5811 RepID=S7UUF2_TOXGG|nr:putative U2 small nuclear ribonucleoprotein family protein [Toxoplasma gondii GT1]KAF4642724.1 putative U2 small nuclear ribonucleoprotein family protein [Toxoplasma gondii]KFG36709.1 putative U2 small nuclear ribonucleoprotein family protein [Toxoplasma gondii FOU]KFG59183.1 putative U2 small nuclear ribonucleoprotein family protein [Toxoplasma gondii RUB]KFH00432.1 putative U2 small nuclear ribonucleoprotein family protein [Toxoplasma gondii VAND]KFH07484.1 putative U2 small nuclear ribon